MPEYIVHITQTRYWDEIVIAEDEDEARQLVDHIWDDMSKPNEIETEISSVEPVSTPKES